MVAKKRKRPSWADYYNKDEFSDVEITFGSQRMRAHTIVLCAASSYFKKALGPEAPWGKNRVSDEYRLQDDDPDAVITMLYYAYTSEYKPSKAKRNYWEHHLNVAIAADKYGVPSLEKAAMTKFVYDVREVRVRLGRFDVPRLINKKDQYHDRDGTLSRLIADLLEAKFVSLFPDPVVQRWLGEHEQERQCLIASNFDKLMDTAAFRDMLEADPELMMKHLDRMRERLRDGLAGGGVCGKCEVCNIRLISSNFMSAAHPAKSLA